MDVADAVRLACVEKNAFRRRRLSGVDMRHDSDIADFR
jgi:hypothetical protein